MNKKLFILYWKDKAFINIVIITLLKINMIFEATVGDVTPDNAAASFFGFIGVAVSLSFASK